VSAVAAVKALLRVFSYLYHTVLAVFLMAVAGLAWASGSPSLQMYMLPWTGSTLVYVLFFGSLFGLLTIVLAIRGTLRILFFLWCLVVAVLMVKGYVFSGYRFVPGEATRVLYLILGSLFAVLGAWFQVRKGPRRQGKY
jgi:hypothetical protein